MVVIALAVATLALFVATCSLVLTYIAIAERDKQEATRDRAP